MYTYTNIPFFCHSFLHPSTLLFCCLRHVFLHPWVVLHMFMCDFPSSFIQTLHLPFRIMNVFCEMGCMLHLSSHWSCLLSLPALLSSFFSILHLCVWLFFSCCHSLTSSLIITVSNLLNHSFTMHLSPPICVHCLYYIYFLSILNLLCCQVC